MNKTYILKLIRTGVISYCDEFDPNRKHKKFKEFCTWLLDYANKLPDAITPRYLIELINTITFKTVTYNNIHSLQLAIEIIRSITTNTRHNMENMYLA